MSKYAEPAKTTRAKNTTKMSGTTNKLLWLKKNQQTGKITEWKQGSHVLHFQCLTNTWSGGKGGQKTKTRCNQQPSNVPNTNKTKMHVQNAVKHVKQHENKHKKTQHEYIPFTWSVSPAQSGYCARCTSRDPYLLPKRPPTHRTCFLQNKKTPTPGCNFSQS